ncbi:MAG: hypothetical protein SFU83_04505 [Meiothermus sp.]|nr:hypothetical protein [Meiothermus sp.]
MQQLAEEITQAVRAQQTVGLYFTWNNRGEYRSGFVLIARGELAQLAVQNKTGKAGMLELRGLEPREVVVCPLDDSPRLRDADVPKTAELLALLKSDTAQPVAAPLPIPPVSAGPTQRRGQSTDALVQGVQALLVERMGPGSLRELPRIAALHPPDTQPMQFLDACQKLLEPKLGRQKAARLFDSLRMTV